MQLLIEGSRYTDPVHGDFAVVAVGRFHGNRCFVVNVAGELAVFKARYWPRIFRAPTPVATPIDPALARGVYRGQPCEVQKTADGVIRFHAAVRLH